ncbi:MAG: hypothetical protein HQL23_06420 [Candidatus Omnitrophica bacterium]|nr:hypothetical protein [Candidatus Omnitrophota bacterium]
MLLSDAVDTLVKDFIKPPKRVVDPNTNARWPQGLKAGRILTDSDYQRLGSFQEEFLTEPSFAAISLKTYNRFTFSVDYDIVTVYVELKSGEPFEIVLDKDKTKARQILFDPAFQAAINSTEFQEYERSKPYLIPLLLADIIKKIAWEIDAADTAKKRAIKVAKEIVESRQTVQPGRVGRWILAGSETKQIARGNGIAEFIQRRDAKRYYNEDKITSLAVPEDYIDTPKGQFLNLVDDLNRQKLFFDLEDNDRARLFQVEIHQPWTRSNPLRRETLYILTFDDQPPASSPAVSQEFQPDKAHKGIVASSPAELSEEDVRVLSDDGYMMIFIGKFFIKFNIAEARTNVHEMMRVAKELEGISGLVTAFKEDTHLDDNTGRLVTTYSLEIYTGPENTQPVVFSLTDTVDLRLLEKTIEYAMMRAAIRTRIANSALGGDEAVEFASEFYSYLKDQLKGPALNRFSAGVLSDAARYYADFQRDSKTEGSDFVRNFLNFICPALNIAISGSDITVELNGNRVLLKDVIEEIAKKIIEHKMPTVSERMNSQPAASPVTKLSPGNQSSTPASVARYDTEVIHLSGVFSPGIALKYYQGGKSYQAQMKPIQGHDADTGTAFRFFPDGSVRMTNAYMTNLEDTRDQSLGDIVDISEYFLNLADQPFLTVVQRNGLRHTVRITPATQVVFEPGNIKLKNGYDAGGNKYDIEQVDTLTRTSSPVGGVAWKGVDRGLEVSRDFVAGAKVSSPVIQFDPAMIRQFQNGNFTGASPVILQIVPIANPILLLGFERDPADLRKEKV